MSPSSTVSADENGLGRWPREHSKYAGSAGSRRSDVGVFRAQYVNVVEEQDMNIFLTCYHQRSGNETMTIIPGWGGIPKPYLIPPRRRQQIWKKEKTWNGFRALILMRQLQQSMP